MEGGSNIEFNEKYLDEFIHNNYLETELAMEVISNEKTVRSDTRLDSKDFNNQSLATQAKKGKQLVSTMPLKKNF